jgi:hypothetical protein
MKMTWKKSWDVGYQNWYAIDVSDFFGALLTATGNAGYSPGKRQAPGALARRGRKGDFHRG